MDRHRHFERGGLDSGATSRKHCTNLLGGKERYLLTRRHEMGIPGAHTLASGDFDSDCTLDVVFLKNDNSVHLVWATEPGGATEKFDSSDIQLPGDDAQ